ncbi:MAG: hypothetical protein SGPRY_006488, partial [Prymnesium sp.]
MNERDLIHLVDREQARVTCAASTRASPLYRHARPLQVSGSSGGMVAALHKQIEIGHHVEDSLEAQLKSTQTDSPKLSKEELSLSRAAVRCWVRKLRVQSEQLGSLHADLSESCAALRALRGIMDGKPSDTSWLNGKSKGASANSSDNEEEEEEEDDDDDDDDDEEEEEEEGQGEEGWWTADADVLLCELLAVQGPDKWALIAKGLSEQLGMRAAAAECCERWQTLLREQLECSQSRQKVRIPQSDKCHCNPSGAISSLHVGQAVHVSMQESEKEVSHAGEEFSRIRQRMQAVMRELTAENKKPPPRSAASTARWPVSAAELREVEGHPFLVLTAASEEALKHDNILLLGEHTKHQSQYMANAGLQLSATHLRTESLDDVEIDDVVEALAFGEAQPRQVGVSAFLADERLRSVHDAVVSMAGERGEPKAALLDWLLWAEAKEPLGKPWWIRSAALEHKLMLLLVLQGSFTLHIAGHERVLVSAGHAVLCPAKL